MLSEAQKQFITSEYSWVDEYPYKYADLNKMSQKAKQSKSLETRTLGIDNVENAESDIIKTENERREEFLNSIIWYDPCELRSDITYGDMINRAPTYPYGAASYNQANDLRRAEMIIEGQYNETNTCIAFTSDMHWLALIRVLADGRITCSKEPEPMTQMAIIESMPLVGEFITTKKTELGLLAPTKKVKGMKIHTYSDAEKVNDLFTHALHPMNKKLKS
jgi:hypothetical protein